MNEMIERAARALADTPPGRNWETMTETGRDWWRASAKAALAAVRDPTENEVAAASNAAILGAQYQGYSLIGAGWRAMIDAALS